MAAEQLSYYTPVLVPALHRIQQQFGYLKREALEEYSKQSGIPLYRLQAVASFFPHFQLAPPKKVTLKVCRDMSCHLAGAGKMLRELWPNERKHNDRRSVVSGTMRSRAGRVCRASGIRTRTLLPW